MPRKTTYQPTRAQLKKRASTVKQALLASFAEGRGMQVEEILALCVHEPYLTRNTLSVWIAEHQGRAQAVRGSRIIPGGYIWYHREAHSTAPYPSAERPAEAQPARSAPTLLAPTYNRARAITITLPTLPRITRLRVYAVVVTAYAATLTALEVL
jgi:hypothetical protein